MSKSKSAVPVAGKAAESVEEGGERLPDGVERLSPRVTITKGGCGFADDIQYPHETWGDPVLRVTHLITGGHYDGAIGCVNTTPLSFSARSTMPSSTAMFLSRVKEGRVWPSSAGAPHHVYRLAAPGATAVEETQARQNIETTIAILGDSPWWRHEWFRHNALRWAEHLPRPSERLDGLLSYYQSPQKRLAGIRTPIKPGKYLRKFFSDVLSDEEIQQYGIEWSEKYSPAALHVTQDADEIEAVYRGRYNGSCMHFENGGWQGSCHPARVYAGPDLGVAYIGSKDAADARCLVWPEKKIYYAKWYGDYHRLELALEAAGFKSASASAFHGARIRRIYDEDIGYTLPYVDVASYAYDDGEYLILGRGEIDCKCTSGAVEGRSRYTCDACDDAVDEDDVNRGPDDGHYCAHCYNERWSYCELLHDDVSVETIVEGRDRWGHAAYYSTDAIEHGLAFLCEARDLLYPTRFYSSVELADGRTVESGWAEYNCTFCEYEEVYYDTSTDDEPFGETSDGRRFALRNQDCPGFAAWLGDATVILPRDEHPDQLTLDADLAVAA